MNVIKSLIKKYFQYFSYFYSHLKYRVFISLILSLLVGVLDGLGLAMFLPLLQMTDGSNQEVDTEQLGSLSFLVEGFAELGIPFNLFSVLLIIFFFFSCKGIMKFLEGYYRVIYQQYFIKNIRISNADLLSNYSYNAFVTSDSGKIQNTFSGEVQRVNAAYKHYFLAVQSIVLVIVYLTLAFLSNPQFALIVIIGGVLTNFIFKNLYAITKKKSTQITKEMHEFQGLLIQKVSNFKYLKATGFIYSYANKLKSKIEEIEQSQRKIGMLGATLQALREPLTILIVVTAIILQVFIFNKPLGLIILSLLFLYRALSSLMTIQNYWNNFLGVSGSLDNMTEFTKDLKANKESFGKVPFKGFKTKLKISEVVFAFEKEKILDNISFDINKNESIAIVGESGSGKTTLLNILAGLIKPIEGVITIDEMKMKELDIRTFQKRIGYITQEPVIFSDNVYNNVTFWDKRTPENIKRFNEALRQAAIFDFVNELELKDQTQLGNNGINLSGGQRQRISISRELYKEVDFLMMDEATSSLDSETEKAIQENIDVLKGKYTIITIAHRLSTVKNADKIILLNKGTIDKIGTFEELLEQSGSFKRMVSLQEF
ncbi:ABC transporter ATP-binding protein [Marivirga sp. S37H4]|uniref:ABC transporter ATP-binding protein n=1 Tax=Marivirga aurantiaca TaxID=2802615 RepID=A0A934WX73_9BACT|nr:ABC transporter ATP-binding protein [Marivirga aurantiaca]MBK6264511.1 ABC transporter ATP-binding protein [Marivirga aurantiaca]